MVEEQLNVLENHWPPDRSVINKSHGSDWAVVVIIRPHTSDMKKTLTVFFMSDVSQTLRRVSERHSAETASDSDASLHKPVCPGRNRLIQHRQWIKNMACERKQT